METQLCGEQLAVALWARRAEWNAYGWVFVQFRAAAEYGWNTNCLDVHHVGIWS